MGRGCSSRVVVGRGGAEWGRGVAECEGVVVSECGALL